MSFEGFPNVTLRPCGPVSNAVIANGLSTFLQVAERVANLPYGRNTDRANYHLVLTEQRGTCSTKHAFLAALANEQQIDVSLVLGIYEMDNDNTPGIGTVLEAHGLRTLPEAHCFLLYQGRAIDVTMPPCKGAARIERAYLFKEVISPDGIGTYKIELHRRILREWLRTQRIDLSLEFAWKIREDCIRALSR